MNTNQDRMEWLSEVLGLLDKGMRIRRIYQVEEEVGKEKWAMSYRMQLTTGAVVNLGQAKHVLKFGKVAEAFAEACGHVIPWKEKTNWEHTSQLIFDIEKACAEEEDSAKAEEVVAKDSPF